ncbi:hypothetical protein EYW49_11855 [Siculibacillus lacustris]|uniref:Peptidoglycan binding-like domain-containing protein n=1 Tax=Siculibacillus lacustris TaxID=1549641 RepID=A0A4Q9VNL1_9HYPH|nr:peptidoglycan-binding protein [Siculibacillus lacustris]TBW37159.1 hypothetical protein EYW49_11855 [Siculibacillus lacustris]
MSWGGRNSDDEIRDRVLDAARRSGLSVGAFVDALGGSAAPAAVARRDDRAVPVELDRQLGVLSDRLKRLSAADGERRRPRPRGRDRDPEFDEIAATLDRLGRSGDREPRRAPRAGGEGDLGAILTALDGLDRRVRALGDPRPAPFPEPEPPRRVARAEPAPTALADLDRAIAEIAERQQALERGQAERQTRAGSDLDRHFQALSEKIDLLRGRDDRESTTVLIGEIRALRETIERRAGLGTDVSGELRRLTGKIDDLAALKPARETLEPVMTEMGRLRDAVLQADVEGSLRSLEAGYGRIVGRLDEIKQDIGAPNVGSRIDSEISEIHGLLRSVPQVGQVAAIERALRDLADKVETLAARDDDPRTAQIERRIAEFKNQIEQIDPTPMIKALDQRLKLLGDKLDGIERATRGPVSPDRVAALFDEMRTIAAGGRVGEEIRAVEKRLGELAARIAEAERRRPSAEDTDRLHDRIAAIAGKIDAIQQPSFDPKAIDALEATIARLDEVLARQAEPRPAPFDARVDEIIARLDRDPQPTADVEALTREVAAMRRDLARTGSSDLEAQMRSLVDKLERSSAPDADDETLAQIEDHLVRISERLATSEERFAGFETLQDHIRRLDQRLETQHVEAIGAARDAAREMVREIGQVRGDGAGETVMRALQDDLRALQSAARDTETRTNDTLISLHDALTGIVGRLSAIEKIAQSSARQAAARNPGTAASDAALASVATGLEQTLHAPTAAPTGAATPTPTPTPAPAIRADSLPIPPPVRATATIAGRPVEPVPAPVAQARLRDLLGPLGEDTRPLEPGSGKPSTRGAAARGAAPQPEAAAESGSAAARKADFIAAARRAAQAAATAAADPAPEVRPAPTADTAADASDDPKATGPLSRIGQALKNRRRPLVLATAAVVLAILTLRLMPMGETSAPQSARIDRPAATQTATATPATATTSASPRLDAKPADRVAADRSAERAPSEPRPTESRATETPPHAVPDVAAVTPPPPPAAPQPTANTSSLVSPAPTASVARRFGEMSAPRPDGSLLSAPTTTGSIPPQESRAPATPAAPAIAAATPAPTTATAPTAPTAPSATAAPAPAVDLATLPPTIGSETLRRAALSGDPKAALEVGLRFAEGRGVPADPTQAGTWFRRAAEGGSVPAQYRWAVSLEKALGVPRDTEQAKRWYTAAAEAGNVRAMHNLGVLYANARDMTAAIPWFQKAADRGLKDSQFNLGIIHALGSGVRQDLAVSYKWFALAARQGDTEAEKKVTDVTAHLDRVTLATARMAVQTWVQQSVDVAANDEAAAWSEAKPAPATAAKTFDGDAVIKVQNLLKAAGVYGGPADGEMGPRTRTAIRTYQKKIGQPQTGEIDSRLLEVLSGGRTM